MLHHPSYLDITQPVHIHKRALPHWHQEGKIQFITFRLGDSLPQSKLNEIQTAKQQWLEAHPQPWDQAAKQEYRRQFSQQIEQYLDRGYGECVLNRPEAAQIVAETFNFYNRRHYLMHAYVVMPNHVHMLMEPAVSYNIKDIVKSWKSFSALRINRLLGRTGSLWQREYFDTLIRSPRHYKSAQGYIVKNHECGGITYYNANTP